MSNQFYWEPKHLNIKKVIGIIVIILIIISSLIVFGLSKLKNPKQNAETRNTSKKYKY